jgi:hypothetical protein
MQADELVAIEAASVMFNIGSTWKSSSRADAAFSIKWSIPTMAKSTFCEAIHGRLP